MSDYDWTPTHHWDIYALRVRLEALCRVHEAKQGWIPCRRVRALLGVHR